ncbi:MAG: response regulator transcription factor [Lachnospiraceae bacterium]|nr:response regulator transcription factor [Lachnospiraceae bacterium]
MYRILVIEDDRGIAEAIVRKIEMWNFSARCVEDFRNVMHAFTEYDPHLVVLDISLPFFNGYHWCSEIRKVSKVPIVFVSSASDNMNIVMAMNLGADDFITKPFDADVMMAKLMAMLRRTYDFADRIPVLEHRGAFLNMNENTLQYEEQKVDLTKNEYRILLTLMEQKGTVISREKLMERLWETDSFVDDNTLTVNINRLRKKLSAAGLEDFIVTKFGVGYLIEAR